MTAWTLTVGPDGTLDDEDAETIIQLSGLIRDRELVETNPALYAEQCGYAQVAYIREWADDMSLRLGVEIRDLIVKAAAR